MKKIQIIFLVLTIALEIISAANMNYLKMVEAPPLDPCYSDERAKKCIPDFVNAAYGVPVKTSSTCGLKGLQTFCDEANLNSNSGPNCYVCDETDPKRRYPAVALTDVPNSNNVTCWRSEPIQNSNQMDNVTLTLSLGKKFELTYIT